MPASLWQGLGIKVTGGFRAGAERAGEPDFTQISEGEHAISVFGPHEEKRASQKGDHAVAPVVCADRFEATFSELGSRM